MKNNYDNDDNNNHFLIFFSVSFEMSVLIKSEKKMLNALLQIYNGICKIQGKFPKHPKQMVKLNFENSKIRFKSFTKPKL